LRASFRHALATAALLAPLAAAADFSNPCNFEHCSVDVQLYIGKLERKARAIEDERDLCITEKQTAELEQSICEDKRASCQDSLDLCELED
jgi:hypothetical protein